MPVFAVDCDLLAVQVQGITDKHERNQAIQTYNALCNGGQSQQQQQPETQQQYVPSIGKTCTIINGQITECWN